MIEKIIMIVCVLIVMAVVMAVFIYHCIQLNRCLWSARRLARLLKNEIDDYYRIKSELEND